ncbi:polysaccharide pyruvyl transferase family protein [Sphingobacterium suaedae]|uniref:Polysaccharide pyruvyl transferase family protein n=1 Tax=Sphingobacterium suaedae TaxID=1686402 RepID=A0ABW5KM73_9SPHI
MFKTDILFSGFYGQLNTGDDAFVEVASWGAKKYWNKDHNRFLAKETNLPKTITPTKGYPFSIRNTYGLQAEFLLNRSKAFVFAGGSTIHSKMPANSIRMKALEKRQKKYEFRLGAIGVSVGPFKTASDEAAVIEYLKRMDFLAVRDQASFDYVSSLSLPFTPVNAFDLAALLPEIYDYQPSSFQQSVKKCVGISVCPYESVQKGLDPEDEIRRNNMLVDLIKELSKEDDLHFKFYIINGSEKIGDQKLTLETIAKANPKSYEVIAYSSSTESIWRSIADCDFIVSTRLHAAIFACFAGTPFMLNEYHRKCSDFLDSVGYPTKYRLYNSEYSIKEKADMIIDVVRDKRKYSTPIKVEQMRDQAKLNFIKIQL